MYNYVTLEVSLNIELEVIITVCKVENLMMQFIKWLILILYHFLL